MATIQVVDNFSTQAWASSSGTPVRGTTFLHGNEPNSLEISTTAANEFVYYSNFGGAPTRVMTGFWFYFSSFPGADAQIAKIDVASCEARLIMQSSGEPYIKADGSPTMASQLYGSNLSTGTWYWVELMLDVSANPWEFRAIIGATTLSTTGALAASDGGNGFVLLGTNRADTITCYYSYLHYGTATGDTDWFGEQSQSAGGTNVSAMMLGVG